LIFISIFFSQSRIITPDGEILPYSDFKKTYPETCRAHGGINCSDKDTDGSVVCLDGFKDSPQQFIDECTIAELTVVLQEGGKVLVKNQSPVAAKGIKVYYSKTDLTKVFFSGPSELEAYGLAEFLGRGRQAYEHLVVDCENCGPKQHS